VRAGAVWARREVGGLRDGGLTALALSLGIAALTVLIFLTIPELLIGAFIDPDDPARPEILAIGVTLMFVAALFQAFDGLQVVALGLLRGVQDTRAPMVIAAVSYWGLGIPAGAVLGFYAGFEGVGVWFGLVVGLAAAAFALSFRFWRYLLSEPFAAQGANAS